MHRFRRWLPLAWRIVRYLTCWALLFYVAGRLTEEAWTCYDSDEHRAGTTGHCTVDFGGQWFTGKLILRGEGRHLYERRHLWAVFEEAWPPDPYSGTGVVTDKKRLKRWLNRERSDDYAAELLCSYLMPLGANNGVEAAAALAGGYQGEESNRDWCGNPWIQRDADWFMWWLVELPEGGQIRSTWTSCLGPLATQDPFGVAALAAAGQDKAWTESKMKQAPERCIGGQLYPPIHAFLYVPLALFDPVTAYRIAIVLPLFFALLAGWGLTKVTNGGLWWPVGTLLVVGFPHFVDAQTLGHNGALIVTLLVWGYYFLQKNDDIRGGLLWGLIAYKPSWAVMHFVLLIVARRWKAAFAMGVCGVAQILLTLPFVGVHSWIEWTHVVGSATPGYGIYKNWANTALDLLSYPRRAWTDWTAPEHERDLFETKLLGWILIGIALEVTVRLTTFGQRHDKRWSYASGAFLLLGFWMCCYHITYYDAMFAALPFALLLMVPSHLFVPYYFRRTPPDWEIPTDPLPPETPPSKYGWICNPLIVYLLPLVFWNPSGSKLINKTCEWLDWCYDKVGLEGGWNFAEISELLPASIPPWIDQPLTVPLFAIAWLWAGWMWLREKDYL